MKYAVIILAAGSGKRMNLGYNKMLLELHNKPLITLTTSIFFQDENCEQIIFVMNSNEVNTIKELLVKANLFDRRCSFTTGGRERQYSVFNGLQLVNSELVLVHDGARPFVKQELINNLTTYAKTNGCAIPAVKVKDTIKILNNGYVEKTLPRDLLVAVQTPQACVTSALKAAHQKAQAESYLGTDEASLIEKYSDSLVKVVEGSYDNLKITTIEDLDFANKIYYKYFKEDL